MLTALVLVCSITAALSFGECTRDNATMVVRVPAEFDTPSACMMRAQAYFAQTSMVQDLRPNDRIKIVCEGAGGAR